MLGVGSIKGRAEFNSLFLHLCGDAIYKAFFMCRLRDFVHCMRVMLKIVH